ECGSGLGVGQGGRIGAIRGRVGQFDVGAGQRLLRDPESRPRRKKPPWPGRAEAQQVGKARGLPRLGFPRFSCEPRDFAFFFLFWRGRDGYPDSLQEGRGHEGSRRTGMDASPRRFILHRRSNGNSKSSVLTRWTRLWALRKGLPAPGSEDGP